MEHISQKGYQELLKKINDISKQIEDTQRKMGESAKRDNDLRENSEYMELRVKAMHNLPKEKQKLLDRYNNAIIIEETEEYKKHDGKSVIMGVKVKLLIDGEEEIYTILGNKEGDYESQILSCDSDMAKAILKKKLGESIIFNNMNITILAIEKI